MKIRSVLFLILGVLSGLPGWLAADPVRALPRGIPESQGVSSEAILAFVEEADRTLDSLHSLMILRHGQVIAEGWWAPYDAGSRHELYSLSKSFTSTAVGLAIAEGRLSVDDEVLKFFGDQAPADVPANLRSMRIRDLLCMSAGHQTEAPTSPDKMTVRAFLGHPVPFKPGTRFLYNTPATFMLSAIVQKATGQTVRDFLEPRLFAPLGIKLRVNGRDQSVVCGLDRWHPGRLAWETLPERPVAASGAWTASDRYEARICFRETPYTLKLPLRFEGTRVTVEPEYNVFFGPGKLPAVTGDAD